MSNSIKNLAPERVWKHFYSLTQIPRPSKNEAAVIEYVKNFGLGLGLETIVDQVGNVIIRKPATSGMENRQGVILQGHLDMVPQKNSDKAHDFTKDPIEAYIDGEWVTANGTTLGADNGMGVAAAMAVLEATDIAHGPVEGLFTMDEETGMTGAFNLKPGLLKGDILLNMDSEDEGELYIGCAGGLDANISFSYNTEEPATDMKGYVLKVVGLKGGHSGMDIVLGRGNSNKVMFRLLKIATRDFGLRLSSIEGGSLRNAIPREAFAVVAIPADKAAGFDDFVKNFEAIVKSELSGAEPDMKIFAERCDLPAKVILFYEQTRIINGIYACPNGVIRMSTEMSGLVETSTNLAIVKSENDIVSVKCLMRSSVDTAKDDLAEMLDSAFAHTGAVVEFSGGYPGWKPNPNSAILKTMLKVYEQKYGRVPEIKAIHAGLECGILGAAYPHWDMISFGPTIRYPHSPDEKVHIGSVSKFWDYLVETLKNVPLK
jgi:dipeptidase D